ncbi:MAG: hypothetical protein QOH43_1016 [Solirubrobacteraceae bacterium]|jgi:hypothetical protein|nr:hypothetical protein [Solirubrobacteraceae bacterium]
MKHSLTVAAATLGALAAPATASAMVADIGKPATQIAAACPGKPCLAVSRTTGFQAKEGDSRAVDVVPQDGRIVAWSITLSDPGTKQTKFFNENLGGEAIAQLTVVRPGRKLYYRVIAQGEPQKLTPYFGQTVQFPLEKSIPVKKGMVIGLSVPTWAPALGVNQPGTTSWRASRKKGTCDDFSSATAQTGVNNVTRFYCLYRTARLLYSATLVTDPQPTSKQTTTTTTTPTTTTPTTTTPAPGT